VSSTKKSSGRKTTADWKDRRRGGVGQQTQHDKITGASTNSGCMGERRRKSTAHSVTNDSRRKKDEEDIVLFRAPTHPHML